MSHTALFYISLPLKRIPYMHMYIPLHGIPYCPYPAFVIFYYPYHSQTYYLPAYLLSIFID